MASWFDKLFPQASPDNPIFNEEVQQVWGPHTPKALLGYSLLVTYLISFAVILWYVLPENNHSLGATKLLLAVLGLFAIGFALLSDITCIRLAIHSLREQSNGVDKQALVSARLTLTEIRAWRFIGLETAFRVALFLVLIIGFLNLGNWTIGQEMNAMGGAVQHIVTLSNQLAANPGAWGILLAMVILIVIQMLEPVWRLRTLATLGLKQAVQNPDTETSSGLPNVVIVWVIALVVYVVPAIFLFVTLRNALLNSWAFGLVAYALVVGVSIWGLYDWLEGSALKQIEMRTQQPAPEQPAMAQTAEDKP